MDSIHKECPKCGMPIGSINGSCNNCEPKQKLEEEYKDIFEANMLDGDDVYACGKAMLSAEEVFEFHKDWIAENYISREEVEKNYIPAIRHRLSDEELKDKLNQPKE